MDNLVTVSSLSDNEKELEKKAIKNFADHLTYFINGITKDEHEQKELLHIAKQQFNKLPLRNINPKCKKCNGRGFTGYNQKYGFLVCPSCFKELLNPHRRHHHD